MLVKISGDYAGKLGRRIPESGMVELMDRESGAFELPDSEASWFMSQGVCVPANDTAADWGEIKAKAKALGINYVGKTRKALEEAVREAAEDQPEGENPLELEAELPS